MSKDKPRKGKHKTEKPSLSAREIRFAQLLFEYGVHGKSRAYLEAGYPPGPTQNATECTACRIARKIQFREYLRELQAIAADAARTTIEEMIADVRNMAKADRTKMFDKNGNILPADQIPKDVKATIEGIESEEVYEPIPGERGKKQLVGHVRKVKTGSRLAAYRLLAELKRFVGQDKDATAAGKKEEPFRVGGDANPDALTAP